MDLSQVQTGEGDTNDDFKIRGAASKANNATQQTSTPPIDACTICLEQITERAVAAPCNHLAFDFICLVSWLQERSTCPLCNAEVARVEYDWRDPQDFKTYHVQPHGSTVMALQESSRRRRGTRPSCTNGRQGSQSAASTTASSYEDPALERRRRVYRERLFSLYIGANKVSGYRNFTQPIFANSPEMQNRARIFLRRELQVFSFLDTPSAPCGGNKGFLVEYIVAILKVNEIKGAEGTAESLLSEYLGASNSRLLLHELEAWLRSPFARLVEWDEHVQYADRPGSSTHKAVDPG